MAGRADWCKWHKCPMSGSWFRWCPNPRTHRHRGRSVVLSVGVVEHCLSPGYRGVWPGVTSTAPSGSRLGGSGQRRRRTRWYPNAVLWILKFCTKLRHCPKALVDRDRMEYWDETLYETRYQTLKCYFRRVDMQWHSGWYQHALFTWKQPF